MNTTLVSLLMAVGGLAQAGEWHGDPVLLDIKEGIYYWKDFEIPAGGTKREIGERRWGAIRERCQLYIRRMLKTVRPSEIIEASCHEDAASIEGRMALFAEGQHPELVSKFRFSDFGAATLRVFAAPNTLAKDADGVRSHLTECESRMLDFVSYAVYRVPGSRESVLYSAKDRCRVEGRGDDGWLIIGGRVYVVTE